MDKDEGDVWVSSKSGEATCCGVDGMMSSAQVHLGTLEADPKSHWQGLKVAARLG